MIGSAQEQQLLAIWVPILLKVLLEDVYNADVSIQAREHSTTTIYLETGEQKALRAVEKNVGVTYNAKGCKVLPPQYRIIQGGGVHTEEIGRILSWMETMKFSTENVAFGCGYDMLEGESMEQCLRRMEKEREF